MCQAHTVVNQNDQECTDQLKKEKRQVNNLLQKWDSLCGLYYMYFILLSFYLVITKIITGYVVINEVRSAGHEQIGNI